MPSSFVGLTVILQVAVIESTEAVIIASPSCNAVTTAFPPNTSSSFTLTILELLDSHFTSLCVVFSGSILAAKEIVSPIFITSSVLFRVRLVASIGKIVTLHFALYEAYVTGS